MNQELAKIRFGEDNLTLTLEGWASSSPRLDSQVRLANTLSKPPYYEYREWHGGYGKLLASQIVERIGGELDEPPQEANEIKPAVPPSPFARKSAHFRPAGAPLTHDVKGLHEYGCVLALLPDDLAAECLALGRSIPDRHLGPEGREKHIHVTVKFGLPSDTDVQELKAILVRHGPIPVKLGDLSLFENNEDGDVLKIDVESESLHELNSVISKHFPCTDTHPEYHPHVTIAYLKPEFSQFWAGREFPLQGRECVLGHCEYSSPSGHVELIPLAGECCFLCAVGMPCVKEKSFTGQTEDSLGRTQCYREGEHVSCATGSPTPSPEQPAEEDILSGRAGEEYKEKGTRAKSFLDWFGPWDTNPAESSKVVDPRTGEPQEEHGTARMVHHGTRGKFTEFSEGKVGTGGGLAVGKGYYFAENRDIAEAYAGIGAKKNPGKVITAYLNVRKPYDFDAELSQEDVDRLQALAREMDPRFDEGWFLSERGAESSTMMGSDVWEDLKSSLGTVDPNEILERAGFDGLTHLAAGLSGAPPLQGGRKPTWGRVWVAFRPNQVKSVDNRGTFDPVEMDFTKAFPDYDVKSVESELRKVCESFSDIEGLGPDYQRLFWNPKTRTAWWESFDGDEEEGAQEVKRRLEKVRGVEKVEVEAEASPRNREGWTEIKYKSLPDYGIKSEGHPCLQGEAASRTGCIPLSEAPSIAARREPPSETSGDQQGKQKVSDKVRQAVLALHPSAILQTIMAAAVKFKNPRRTVREVREKAVERLRKLHERYGTAGACAIAGAYAGYYAVAAMNPIMFAVPVPLTLTIMSSAEALRYGWRRLSGRKSLGEDWIESVKEFIAESARDSGEEVPELDWDLLEAVAEHLHQLAERGPNMPQVDGLNKAMSSLSSNTGGALVKPPLQPSRDRPEDASYLFVYGTLRSGHQYHRFLEGEDFVGPVTTMPGYSLQQEGSFPALEPGHASVRGELYKVGPDRMSMLEGWEDHYELAPVQLRGFDKPVVAFFWKKELEHQVKGEGQPCGPGQSASRTGCIPASVSSNAGSTPRRPQEGAGSQQAVSVQGGQQAPQPQQDLEQQAQQAFQVLLQALEQIVAPNVDDIRDQLINKLKQYGEQAGTILNAVVLSTPVPTPDSQPATVALAKLVTEAWQEFHGSGDGSGARVVKSILRWHHKGIDAPSVQPSQAPTVAEQPKPSKPPRPPLTEVQHPKPDAAKSLFYSGFPEYKEFVPAESLLRARFKHAGATTLPAPTVKPSTAPAIARTPQTGQSHPMDVPFKGPSGRWFVLRSSDHRVVPSPGPGGAEQGETSPRRRQEEASSSKQSQKEKENLKEVEDYISAVKGGKVLTHFQRVRMAASLFLMTVDQLKELKDRHGIEADAEVKEALVRKINEHLGQKAPPKVEPEPVRDVSEKEQPVEETREEEYGPEPERGSGSGPDAEEPGGAGGGVEGEAEGPGDAGADQAGEAPTESPGEKAPQRVPASQKEVGRRLDRFEKLFRSRGHREQADWMNLLRSHVNEVGTDEALKSLGEEADTKEGSEQEVLYEGGVGWNDMSGFMQAYLNRHGIVSVHQGMTLAPDRRSVSSLTEQETEGPGRGGEGDFKPQDPGWGVNKLKEAQHLPGLEKSEDLSRIMGGEFGSAVTHFTPEVISKLDETYGKDGWIVKPYDDEGFAGRGIFFPQFIQGLPQNARNALWTSGQNLANYGFSHLRDESGRVVGIKHSNGDEYRFGTEKYESTIQGDARRWADEAEAVAGSEKAAELPFGGRGFMAQPAFPVVGISEEERAQGVTIKKGAEGRTHIITRNGKAEWVPHSTWMKKESLPVVFENNDTRAMAQAAVDAINALPESERSGQTYAPDIVKTAEGFKVIEANPSAKGGGSGYLEDNAFIIDSYVSSITGREPAHVRFIRKLLTSRKKGEKGYFKIGMKSLYMNRIGRSILWN